MCQYIFFHLCFLVSSLSSGGEARSRCKLPGSPQDGAAAGLQLHDADIEDLVAADTNLNWANPAIRGATPLHVAARFNNLDAVTALLNAGEDKDHQDDDGWTPLYYASHYGSIDATNILIANRANIDIPSKFGRTALHQAAYNNHPAIVRILLDAGADRDSQDGTGATPLNLASRNGNIDVANMLIADIGNPQNDGTTLVGMASSQRHLLVVSDPCIPYVPRDEEDKKMAALEEFIENFMRTRKKRNRNKKKRPSL